jgi:hypothetical protein
MICRHCRRCRRAIAGALCLFCFFGGLPAPIDPLDLHTHERSPKAPPLRLDLRVAASTVALTGAPLWRVPPEGKSEAVVATTASISGVKKPRIWLWSEEMPSKGPAA